MFISLGEEVLGPTVPVGWPRLFHPFDFVGQTSRLLAWMPDELSPAHNIFGREVRSGIAPLGKNYDGAKADQTNQIVRAGFIR